MIWSPRSKKFNRRVKTAVWVWFRLFIDSNERCNTSPNYLRCELLATLSYQSMTVHIELKMNWFLCNLSEYIFTIVKRGCSRVVKTVRCKKTLGLKWLHFQLVRFTYKLLEGHYLSLNIKIWTGLLLFFTWWLNCWMWGPTFWEK